MATTQTTRLALTKPDLNEMMNLGDNVLSANYDIVDLNVHQRIVATTAAIVTPYEGQAIYATTPAENYVRKFGAWIKTNGAPPGFAGGPKGFKVKGGDNIHSIVATPSSDQLLYSATFTAESGRKYLIEYHVNVTKESTVAPPSIQSGTVRINFRRNAGGTVNNTHTQISNHKTYFVFTALDSTGTTAGQTGDGLNGFIEWTSDISGTVTIGMFALITTSEDWYINNVNLAPGNPGWTQTHFHVTDWDSV